MVRAFVLAFLCFFSFSTLNATPLQPDTIPDPLKPWVTWVLQDQVQFGCPFLFNNYAEKRCSWPDRLGLTLNAQGGKFDITWSLEKEGWAQLPGNERHWPQNVNANGKATAVINRNGLPSLKLAAGHYEIQGEFLWDAIPESLDIPADSGLVSLSVNGSEVGLPTIKDNQLWLTGSVTGSAKTENVQNSLDIQVFRKMHDSVPMMVSTRLILEVSGEPREIKLAKPYLDGFIPLNLLSLLPARIEDDGQLLVQLRPGRWQITVESRGVKETNALPLTVSDPIWPESEIWLFESRPDLRITEVENLEVIDASQTNSPEEWRHLPAYRINKGEQMTLKVIRRGDPDPDPNQLTINRKLWLDFNGSGYTINDIISGKMTRGWRLDALPETRIGKIALDGNDQLITLGAGGKKGVEVRKGMISLDADSRIEGNVNSISAVGWEQDFKQVNAELNLPPGWRLLAASGVDNVPNSWLSQWTLLDLFLVLIAALVTNNLYGRIWGGITLTTLVLIWHETGSPHLIWLNILAATSLLKVLPQGKLSVAATWYRNVSFLVLAFLLLPFMVNQVRIGLYPQLEYPWISAELPPPASPAPTASYEVAEQAADSAVSPEVAEEAPLPKQTMRKQKAEIARGLLGSSYDSSSVYTRYDPKAKVQTGPGLPQWQWNKVYLSWNGSVDAGQSVRLWYLSPSMTLLLNLIRVALASLLAVLMFGFEDRLPVKFKTSGLKTLLIGLLLVPMLTNTDKVAQADIPSKEILDELKNRLLEAPDCLPNCAAIGRMEVAIDEQSLTLSLRIQAQQSVNIPLPAAIEHWLPREVTLDGKPASGLYRNANLLWFNAPAGDHELVMRGNPPPLATFTLPLPLKPGFTRISAKNWEVSGLQDNGQAENQLQFSRLSAATSQDTAAKLAPGALPAFVKIQRTLQLGLDWRMTTEIVKQSPPESVVALEIPLISGEKITTPGVYIKDGKAQVNLPAQQTELRWESTLEKSDKIDLQAADTQAWSEIWRADISPIWHVETKGIAMIHLNPEGQWLPEWHPWPGETLTLSVTRPSTLDGQTLTIDSSQLTIKPGQRSQDADLQLSVRSSQGTQQTITLPEKAELQGVSINGQSYPLRQEGRKLTLPVNPGKQSIALNWQMPQELGGIIKTPEVDLGQGSVNARLNVTLGNDRWVLWVWGPKLGPAVLFWGMLVVIVIVSVGFGKIPLTPLKTWQWFLLLLGLSQAPMESAAIVVGWLFLLGWRGQKPSNDFRFFNLLQTGIGILTLFALSVLLFVVEQGLLGGSPDMQIVGNNSSAYALNWYQDRADKSLPQAMVVSLPLFAYRLLMLAWSFWLAASLLKWLKWGWRCFSANGYWNKKPSPIQTATSVDGIEKK